MSRREFLKKTLLSVTGLPHLSFVEKTNDSSGISIIRPPKLKHGDIIGLVAPASAILKSDAIHNFQSFLENAGFQVLKGKFLENQYGYLAGTDEERAADFNEMLRNEKVKAIIAMRGGWGCARILPLIDYEAFQKYPKVIAGFSDITSLLLALYAKTGVVTFHTSVGYSNWTDFTFHSFMQIVAHKEKPKLKISRGNNQFYTITPGKAVGRLIGGNLAVLSGIVGSEYLPSFENAILFLEEINEEVYRIDRMLTHLKLAGILSKINGFVFGHCEKCDPEEPEHSLSLQQVLEYHLKPLGIPAFYGAPFGHIPDKCTLPIGISAEIYADKGVIKILDEAVT
ncbi:MAG: LD-carboxypeptidase [Cytophagales bacterium]|nr:LD-carboxypeptidase [Cytophagales bacterium]MDW8384425.1 LD-carboxypeptidase [Flammeovirgaceae bacterium]